MAKTNKVNTDNLSKTSVVTLNKLSTVQGWTVKEDTACSPVGTQVRFTAKTVVISNTRIKQGTSKITLKLEEATPTAIIAQIAVIEKRTKEQAVTAPAKPENKTAPAPAPANKPNKGKTNKTGANNMATTPAPAPNTSKKAAAAKKADDAKKAAAAAKPVPVMPANPTPGATPVFDELKTAAEKEEKLESAKREMWSKVGEKYGFSIAPLTRALMIEGNWPIGKDPKGNPATIEMADGTVEFKPMGYQAVYKAEKEQGIKGPGHFVNVAAAAFGRINMEKGKAAAAAAKPTPADESGKDSDETKLTTKQINKLLIQLEQIAHKLPAADLKVWVETSKSIAPILAEIKAEDTALDAL